jgi:hypothetical protein
MAVNADAATTTATAAAAVCFIERGVMSGILVLIAV